MKTSILFLFSFAFCVPASAVLKDQPHAVQDFRFIPIQSIRTVEGLPPTLEVTYEKYCNEEFLKVVREDVVNPATQKTTIAVGVLVKTNLFSSCGGIQKNQKANAGNLFSGRDYEVKLISIK